MPWLLVPVGLGKVGPVRQISVADCGSSFLCIGLMSSYHAASSYFQAFLWWHRGRPACVYFTKYVTSNCLASWECLCYGEGLCVCMLNSMVRLVKGCQVIAHTITLYCSKPVFCLRYAVWATALRGVTCGYVLQGFRVWRLTSKCKVWNLDVWGTSIEVCAARSEV